MLDNFLLTITGQQFENEEQVSFNYSKYMPLLIDVFGEVTIDEVMLAYKLAKSGKLTNHKEERFILYRELNFASASDVLLAFEEYKKEQIGHFVQNQTLFEDESNRQVSENDTKNAIIEFLRESWSYAEQNKLDDLRGALIYDYLKENNLIELSNEEKQEIQELAIELVKNKKLTEQQESVDLMFIRSITHFLDRINGKTDEVVVYSKKIALSHQIRNWIIEEKTITDIAKFLLNKN